MSASKAFCINGQFLWAKRYLLSLRRLHRRKYPYSGWRGEKPPVLPVFPCDFYKRELAPKTF